MNIRGISGKWNAMWHSSPSPKYGLTSAGHWFASASSSLSRCRASISARMRFEDVVRLVEVRARRPFALDEVGHRIEPHAVDAAIEPEVHHPHHGVDHRRVVEVQVRLVMKEPVPVVRARGVVPRPVGLLGVREDDRHALVLLVGIAPDVEVARRRARRRPPRRLEPRMLIRGVVDDELGDDPDVAAGALPR